MINRLKAFRSTILHFVDDPNRVGKNAWQLFEDGVLLIKNGVVKDVGEAEVILPQLPDNITVEHFPNHIISPGFIDAHVHYSQTAMIAAYGEQLLSWLNTYTYPTEKKFASEVYARQIADLFLDELMRNGTTTAMVFATVHKQSAEAFFQAAHARDLRMITGKVLMDRNAPADLLDTPESAYKESCELIKKWQNVKRLQYAVTPRFAPTSSRQQLDVAGRLLKEFEGVYLHTHLAENRDELQWVQELFPASHDYLSVYEQSGLVRDRSVFAHGIHLSEHNCQQLAANGSAVAHCPTSNLFLGSGLCDLPRMQTHGIKLGLGSDIGAGTSFSLFRVMDEAYKIQQLRGASLSPMNALYLATLGGARALDLDSNIGNFQPGKEADFVVLDLNATDLIKFRMSYCCSIEEKVFALNVLGDDRAVERTYILGECAHRRGAQ